MSVPCYAMYRRDRGSRGGGVLVYVTDKCCSRRRNDLEEDGVETLWVEVRMNQRTLLLGNMYRPPNATSSVLDSLELMLERAVSERKEVILMGDFNLNLLAHSTETDRLLQITEDNNLKQLISVPTRITNHPQTLIYLLFTTNPDIFTDTGTAALTGSDHLLIFGECSTRIKSHPQVGTVRSFKRCNTDQILAELANAPWQVMEIYDDINDGWSYWKDLFLSIIDSHAPLVSVRMKVKDLSSEWIDADLRSLLRAMNYYRRKYWKTRTQLDWA